jgi:hypothetical protein
LVAANSALEQFTSGNYREGVRKIASLADLTTLVGDPLGFEKMRTEGTIEDVRGKIGKENQASLDRILEFKDKYYQLQDINTKLERAESSTQDPNAAPESYDPDYIQISLYNNVNCSGDPGLCTIPLPLCTIVEAIDGNIIFEYFDKDRILQSAIGVNDGETITVCAIPGTIVKTSGSGTAYVTTGRACDIYPCDTPCNCYTVDAPSCIYRVEGLSWIDCDGIQQYYPGLPSNPPTPAINTTFCALENTVVYAQSQGHPGSPCPVTITNNGLCDTSPECFA